jgi:hypothetical protein
MSPCRCGRLERLSGLVITSSRTFRELCGRRYREAPRVDEHGMISTTSQRKRSFLVASPNTTTGRRGTTPLSMIPRTAGPVAALSRSPLRRWSSTRATPLLESLRLDGVRARLLVSSVHRRATRAWCNGTM